MNNHEDPTVGVCAVEVRANRAEGAPLIDRADRELRLTFADFIPYLPESLLKPEAVHGDSELFFDLEMVGGLISSGCRSVPVAFLRERAPSFFREEVAPDEGAVVDLPWKRIQSGLEAALDLNPTCGARENPSLTPAGARFLASFFCARRTESQMRRVQNPVAPGVEAFLRNAFTAKRVPPTQAPHPPANPPAPSGRPLAPVADPDDADAELSPTKLRKQRDLARHELARFKQESERHLAALRAQLKEVTMERNDALEALASAMGDENDRILQLELENVVQEQKLGHARAELEAARSRPAAFESGHPASESRALPAAVEQPPGAVAESPAGAHSASPGNATSTPSAEPAPKLPSTVRSPFGLFSRAAKLIVLSVVLVATGVTIVCMLPQFEKWMPPVLRALPPAAGAASEPARAEKVAASTMGGSDPVGRLHVGDVLRAGAHAHEDLLRERP